MPTTDKGTASTSHPRTAPSTSQRRPLFKGTLSPPSTKPTGKSYTLAPVSISEVLIRDPAERRATGTLLRCQLSQLSKSDVEPHRSCWTLASNYLLSVMLTFARQVAALLPSRPPLCPNLLWIHLSCSVAHRVPHDVHSRSMMSTGDQPDQSLPWCPKDECIHPVLSCITICMEAEIIQPATAFR